MHGHVGDRRHNREPHHSLGGDDHLDRLGFYRHEEGGTLGHRHSKLEVQGRAPCYKTVALETPTHRFTQKDAGL